MQVEQHALCHARSAAGGRLIGQALAGVGVEPHGCHIIAPKAHRDMGQFHCRHLAFHPLDGDPGDLVHAPRLAGLCDHGRERCCRAAYRRMPMLAAFIQFIIIGPARFRVGAVDHVLAGRHVGEEKEDQPAIGDHQEEGQRHDADHIMRIQPGTLALARAEGEEVLEDLLVGDDPADDRQQHQHRRHADDPDRPVIGQVVQCIVHAVETETARRFSRFGIGRQDGAAGRVKALIAAGAIVMRPARHFLPADGEILPVAVPLLPVGEDDLPTRGDRCDCGQSFDGPVGQDRAIDLDRRHRDHPLGLHPAANLLLEIARRAGHENEEQQPACHQSNPGVQPGHRLAECVFHAIAFQYRLGSVCQLDV